MRSVRRLTSLVLGATLLAVCVAPGAAAQDASPASTPSPMCGVLTAQEISDAVGITVAVTDSSDDGCNYGADASAGDYFSVASNRTGDSLAAIKQAFTGEATTVGGQDAVFVADTYAPLLFVGTPDGGTYSLMIVGTVGKGIDAKAALTGLAELALTRLATVPTVSTPPAAAEPSFTADKGLEALFPTTVTGLPVTIQSMSGNDLTTNGAAPPALLAALTPLGKTMDDLSVAYGYYTDTTTGTGGLISAFQVDGVQMTDLMGVLLPLVSNGATPASQTQAQIGGKDVTVIKLAADTPDAELEYLYPKNDILWVVQASEPALTEVFTNLP